MPDEFSISLDAAIGRAADGLTQKLATDGLKALKMSLDAAGVSERLGHYEAYSHISGDSVIFEIVVDSSKVVATDAKTLAALREEMSESRKKDMEKVVKSFELGPNGPRRTVSDARRPTVDARKNPFDARRPATDARRPATDARKGSGDRRIENPHGMKMTQDGKIAITLERSTVTGKFGVKFPSGKFQGVMKDFFDRLHGAISSNFSEELELILAKYP